MEAHTGAVTFPREWAKRSRRRRLAELREAITLRRIQRAKRAYSLRSSNRMYSIPGSEHSHLIHRPRGF